MKRSAVLAFVGVMTTLASFGVVRAAPGEPFAPGRVVVAFRAGTRALSDRTVLTPAQAQTVRDDAAQHHPPSSPPAYTNDDGTNRALASIGAYRMERLYKAAASIASPAPNGIDLANTYVVYIAGVNVRQAVATLRSLPTVAYASPDWHVDTMSP